MVSDLGWESLQHRRRVDRLTTLFKIQHGLVVLDTHVVRPGDKRTRGQHRLYQPAAKLSIYKNSFFPLTIRESNLLPTSVTDAVTIEDFRVGLGNALPAFPAVKNSKWVWSGTTTITNRRQPHGNARKSHCRHVLKRVCHAYFNFTYGDFNFWKDTAVSFPSHWSTIHSFEESWPILGRRRDEEEEKEEEWLGNN